MDQPQRANAAQLAARNIKMAKGKHPRRPGLAQKDNSSSQSWATPSSETGLFGGSIQATGTFNFASPSTLKFDTTAFGTMPNQKTDGLQGSIGGGFNQNNQNATTLFGAGAAPMDQSASLISSGFPAGQMPSFGSGGMEKAQKNPGFSFQGGFQAGSFGGTTSVIAPASHAAPTTSAPTPTTAAAPTASSAPTSIFSFGGTTSVTGPMAPTSHTAPTTTAPNPIPTTAAAPTANSAPTSIFSFGSTSQSASKPNSIFGSTGGLTFDLSNQAPSQSASNSIFGFKTQASQNQPLTAEKTSGEGFASPQNPEGSSGALESKTSTLESTHTLYGRQESQVTGNECNLKNLSTSSTNSKSLFGAPQGTSMQGSNFKQNLFDPGLASNACMITQTSQKNSLSISDIFLRDNIQSGEPKNIVLTSSDQPTSASNLFCHQTSTINPFSNCMKSHEFSNVPSKLPSPKVVYDTNQQESTEIEMEISDNLEARKLGLSQDMNSNFSPTQSIASVSIESNLFEPMGKMIKSQNSLPKQTSPVQFQMPGKNDIPQPSTQSTTGPQDSVILCEMQADKKDLTNESGLHQISTDQCGIKAIGDDKHHISVVQPISSKSANNAEIKLSSNTFGQANLSSISSKSSNGSSIRPTQTGFLSQNSKDITSSEVCCVSGNESLTVSTTETEPSKAQSRISCPQNFKKRNKYAPKVLPRNPLFRNLALTSQIKDEEIIASLPVGCDDIEREQFFALYRLRALNQAMGKLFLGLPITSDPRIVLDFYTEERYNILSNCTSLGRKPKRKLSYGESDNYLSKKKRT